MTQLERWKCDQEARVAMREYLEQAVEDARVLGLTVARFLDEAWEAWRRG